jgi:hypothetical protein
MSAQTSTSGQTYPTEQPYPGDRLPASTTQPPDASRALRAFALIAVCVGVAALAAGTFVLSYAGIHALALEAGVAPRLARGYPLLIDAMLVIVLAAVLALRGAGLPSRLLAWITLLAVLAAAAGADALHATGHKLPAQAAAVTIAVVPWVLVFLGFVLLLAMLRHARLRRLAAARARVAAHSEARANWQPSADQAAAQRSQAEQATGRPALDLPTRRPQPMVPSVVPGFAAQPAEPTATEPTAAEPTAAEDGPVESGAAEPTAAEDGPVESGADLAVDTDLPPDDPSSDEGVPEPAEARDDQPDAADAAADALSPAPTAEQQDADMPVFHRMWSTPTPPADS